jgi:hypothetical protein
VKPVGPFLKCYGSKWQGSKHYPAPLEDKPVFEPFAGGAGYSCRYHWFPVTIYESNFNIACLWQWLINSATSQDILDIPLNLPEDMDIRDLGKDLSHGQMLLLKNWQRTNNHGNCWTISKWGHLPGQFTASCRARIAEEIHAIKHWKFEPISWTVPGTYLADPPYIYNYRYGVKDFDFDDYAKKVLALPEGSLAICCEAVCPKTSKVPNYLPFQPSHSQVTSRRKSNNNHHSRELVYVKYT